MKKFILFFVLLHSLCTAKAKAMDAYKFKFNGETVEGLLTRMNQVQKFQIPLTEEQAGLRLITAKAIAKSLGDQSRAEQHLFSFAGATDVQVEVLAPPSHYVFSSFRATSAGYEVRKASQFVVGFADKKIWNLHTFEFEGTLFQLLSPKKDPQIDPAFWEDSIRKIWPLFTKRFGIPTDHLVFVDLQGPISGGPLGENVLGIFASNNFPKSLTEDMEANLGWKPHKSTLAYVKAYYPKSKDQWGGYLIGTFAHEIGHLYFGFGKTRERITNVDELWFSLGLGVVYDMEITNTLVGRPPQLEFDLIENWKNNISKLKDIDQRLINPDKSSDAKYKFDRKKVFAHGKAAYFLGDLRMKVGKEKFDKAVSNYLRECGNCESGYADFKKFLGSDASIATDLEKKHQIL